MFLPRLRLVIVLAGLVFAIAGIATNNRIVIWGAIGMLAVSLLIRLVLKRRQETQG